MSTGYDVTKIGLPETRLGIIPGAGGTQRVTRLLGMSKAKSLIFTARSLTATEALEWGLVDYVSDSGNSAFEKALEIAKEISVNGELASPTVTWRFASGGSNVSNSPTCTSGCKAGHLACARTKSGVRYVCTFTCLRRSRAEQGSQGSILSVPRTSPSSRRAIALKHYRRSRRNAHQSSKENNYFSSLRFDV